MQILHHHFAPGMCFLLFLKPSRCSPYAGVSRFLQPSRHLSQSHVSNLCKTSGNHVTFQHFYPFFFSVFLFLFHQLLSVLPLLDPFLHPFYPHAPTIATFAFSETLAISLHPSFHESSHCLFYL